LYKESNPVVKALLGEISGLWDGRDFYGFWLLASGFWLLASGFWLLASGFWLLASGYRLPASGFRLRTNTNPSINTRHGFSGSLASVAVAVAGVVARMLDYTDTP